MAGYEQVMSNHPVACSRLTRRIKAMFFEGWWIPTLVRGPKSRRAGGSWKNWTSAP
jgi:hypothetical protein